MWIVYYVHIRSLPRLTYGSFIKSTVEPPELSKYHCSECVWMVPNTFNPEGDPV